VDGTQRASIIDVRNKQERSDRGGYLAPKLSSHKTKVIVMMMKMWMER
jgi:hypothetical protein